MPGTFSGNGSVVWVIDVNRVIGNPNSQSQGGRRHHQDGLDETDPNGHFVITIKYPKDPDGQAQFRKALSDAATNTATNVAVLTIPIEDRRSNYDPPTDDQIKIDW